MLANPSIYYLNNDKLVILNFIIKKLNSYYKKFDAEYLAFLSAKKDEILCRESEYQKLVFAASKPLNQLEDRQGEIKTRRIQEVKMN